MCYGAGMQSGIRQPLCSGSANLARWSRLGAAVPGLAFLGFALQCFWQWQPYGAVVGLLLGLGLLAMAVAALVTPGEPASDVILDATGLRVVGGPHHGLALRWDELDPAAIELLELREMRVTGRRLMRSIASLLVYEETDLAPDPGDPTAQLWVGTRAGRRLRLGCGADADEVCSLRALHATLRDRVTPGPLVDDAPPMAVRCPTCAAPARPSEQPVVACTFCHSPIGMPKELRERLAAHSELGATLGSVERLVTRLARLPSARLAAFVSSAVFVVVALLNVILGVSFLRLALAGSAGAFALGLLATTTGVMVAAAWQFGARLVVDRQALGAIGAHFGARAPRREGEGWGCRNCGAPLPDGPGAVLRCGYCDAENIPGLDAGQLLTPLKQQRRVLEQYARRHVQRRSAATWSAAVLGALALAASLVLLVGGPS
jgi:hypothetical protein